MKIKATMAYDKAPHDFFYFYFFELLLNRYPKSRSSLDYESEAMTSLAREEILVQI